MIYYDRINFSEEIDVNKQVHQKSVMSVTISISWIIVLSFNKMSVIDVMIH